MDNEAKFGPALRISLVAKDETQIYTKNVALGGRADLKSHKRTHDVAKLKRL